MGVGDDPEVAAIAEGRDRQNRIDSPAQPEECVDGDRPVRIALAVDGKKRHRRTLIGNARETHFPNVKLGNVEGGAQTDGMKPGQDGVGRRSDVEAPLHPSPIAGPALRYLQARGEGLEKTQAARSDEAQTAGDGVNILIWLKARRVQIQLRSRKFVPQIEAKGLASQLSSGQVSAIPNSSWPDDGAVLELASLRPSDGLRGIHLAEQQPFRIRRSPIPIAGSRLCSVPVALGRTGAVRQVRLIG